MITQFITRSGQLASIDGISEYYISDSYQVILSGNVDGEDCTWGKDGRVRINNVIGLKQKHELDLVSWTEYKENGLYHFTIEQIKRMK